jgi:hypothetical protein
MSEITASEYILECIPGEGLIWYDGPMNTSGIVKDIMSEFSESTGLLDPSDLPRRYLWTDAFAVCNFIGLFRQTGDEDWQKKALLLVDRVHYILGRHRTDDTRKGWISGLSDEEGKLHPTRGGLRIGKHLRERRLTDVYDDIEEWDRDGQYFHYLTKWMHALNRVSGSTANPVFNSWAIELAKAAHGAFVYTSSSGSRRMYWKMSIDLSIGLHAVENPDNFKEDQAVYAQLDRISPFRHWCEAIEDFWLEPRNKQSPTWTEHKDINNVMLATSLAPDGFLTL